MTVTSEAVQEHLVGIPQIADLAGVGRSAVSNWRKRHPHFPTAKVQAPSGALFDLREVEDWLIEQGKISERAPASARLWAMADATRGIWTADEFVRFSVAFLVYLEVSAQAERQGVLGAESAPTIPLAARWPSLRGLPDDFVARFADAARAIEAANPELVGLVDPGVLIQATPDNGLAYQVALTLAAAGDDAPGRQELFEAVSELESIDRFSGEYSTPVDLARLVVGLSESRGGVCLDPVVGEGRLLWQAVARGESAAAPASRVIGIDVNQAAWRRARSRFYLYGHPADIRNENSLAADWSSFPQADVIVADPPYGLGKWGDADLYVDPRWRFGSPPPTSADFAWLQFAALNLKPTGRAAIVMGAGSLTKGEREGDIRKRLLEEGVVEGIVALPPRLRTNTSIPLAIWLLRSPDAEVRTDEVLLVDASELGASGRSRYSLPQPAIDRVLNVVGRWRATQDVSEDDSFIAVSIPLAEILAAGANLNPARYRELPPVDREALQKQVDGLRASVRENSSAASQAFSDLLSYLEARR